jgi:hypothetical protein
MSEVVGCLTCRKRVGRIRGNCDSCYNKHRKAVARGEVTWPELEQRGLVLPAQQKGEHAWCRDVRAEEGA